jgi:ribose transport system substrate-binding protein
MRIPTCDTRCEPSRKPDRDLRLAIIPKDGTQDYWKAVYRGAREAVISATGRITLSWNDPGSENDCVPQIEFIEKALAERVSGIVLGPINAVALVQAVHHAVRANVPVLIIDSALRSERTAGFVASDNFRAGELAARHLGRLLNGEGNVVLLRTLRNSASTEERAKGFAYALHQRFPAIKFPIPPQFAGPSLQSAYETSKNLLRRFGGKINGVFAVNELASSGMLLALQEAGLTNGRIRFVGFDVNECLHMGLTRGEVHGLIVQDPFAIGYLGVKTLTEVLRGNLVAPLAITSTRLLVGHSVRNNSFREKQLSGALDAAQHRCSRPVELSNRERDVLYWIRQGKRDSEIALILGISLRTAETHVFRILKKLGVETRTAAAMTPD